MTGNTTGNDDKLTTVEQADVISSHMDEARFMVGLVVYSSSLGLNELARERFIEGAEEYGDTIWQYSPNDPYLTEEIHEEIADAFVYAARDNVIKLLIRKGLMNEQVALTEQEVLHLVRRLHQQEAGEASAQDQAEG